MHTGRLPMEVGPLQLPCSSLQKPCSKPSVPVQALMTYGGCHAEEQHVRWSRAPLQTHCFLWGMLHA